MDATAAVGGAGGGGGGEEGTDSVNENASYMHEMFPSLGIELIKDILCKCSGSLDRAMDEALSVLSIEEERQSSERERQSRADSRAARDARADSSSSRGRSGSCASSGGEEEGGSGRDAMCSAADVPSKPKVEGRGCVMQLPRAFLSVPKSRIVIDEVHRRYTDFTFYVHKRRGAKVGLTLCRVDGCVALYSVNAALLKLRNDVSEIKTIKPGDILYGINQEFFSHDTSIDHISLVMGNAGSTISLHLRRISSAARGMPPAKATEHAMVKLILQAYKTAPVGFTDGFSESLRLIRQRITRWDDGFILQKIPNKLLFKDSADLSSSSSLISRVFLGNSIDDDVAMPPARRSEQQGSSAGGGGEHSVSRHGRAGTHSILASVAGGGGPEGQIAMIKENWKQHVKVNIQNIQPALNVRILKVVKHRNNGFVEYVLRVSDVRTGHEWNISKGYTDFNDLKKVSSCALLCLTLLCLTLL
jgi:hypothetical protein